MTVAAAGVVVELGRNPPETLESAMTTLRNTVLAAAFGAAFLASPAFAAENARVDACGPAPEAPAAVRLLSHDDLSRATGSLDAFGKAVNRYAACTRVETRDADPMVRAAAAGELSRLNHLRQQAAIELSRAARSFRHQEQTSPLSQVAERD